MILTVPRHLRGPVLLCGLGATPVRNGLMIAKTDGQRLGAHLTIAQSEQNAATNYIRIGTVGLSMPGAKIAAYPIAASAMFRAVTAKILTYPANPGNGFCLI